MTVPYVTKPCPLCGLTGIVQAPSDRAIAAWKAGELIQLAIG